MDNDAFGLRPIPNRSVVDRVMDRITDAIVSGQYPPGSQIPTEEQLSGALGVSRNSVREAVKVLVSLGVLEIRRAEGTFVAASYSERMFNHALYGMIVQENGLKDLIEVRRVFEEGVIQLAIAKGTQKDMERIARCRDAFIQRLEYAPRDYDALMECDIAFHNSIEDAVHNSLLPNLSAVITRLTVPSRRETLRRGIEKGKVGYFIDCHRMLAEIVLTRQSGRVLEAVNYHYDMWSGDHI